MSSSCSTAATRRCGSRRTRSGRSARDGAIGFDQMITIERSPTGADAFMRIHNRDGGEVDACGNATRCVGWLLMGENGRKTATIETNAGLLSAFDTGDAGDDHGRHGQPALRLATRSRSREPFDDTRAIELQIGPIDAPILSSPSAVSMGNPHAIFWVDDVEAYRPRPHRADPREPPDLPGARQHLARPCHGARRDHGEDLGARRRHHPGLRHRRLRRRGRGDAEGARPTTRVTVTLPGGPLRRRMARRRPRLDDRPGRDRVHAASSIRRRSPGR